MPHTYVIAYYHVVFSTKNRLPTISAEVLPRLHAYLGGINREHGGTAMSIGGVEDHVHLLLQVPSTLAIAKLVQLIKGGASKWMNEQRVAGFAWQEGYGAFTIGQSQISDTRSYIEGQAEHHQHSTFQDEYRRFLVKHGIEWDEKYVWG